MKEYYFPMAKGWFRDLLIPMKPTESAPPATSRETFFFLPLLRLYLLFFPLFCLDYFLPFDLRAVVLNGYGCYLILPAFDELLRTSVPTTLMIGSYINFRILELLFSLPSPRRYITSFDPPPLVLHGLLFSYFCLIRLSLHLSVQALKIIYPFMKPLFKTLAIYLENKSNCSVPLGHHVAVAQTVLCHTNVSGSQQCVVEKEFGAPHGGALETLNNFLENKGIISDLLKSGRAKNREENPLVDFDATNNRACQSGLLVSNSVETNAREASKGPCMTEGVLSLVDSATKIPSTDSDAPGDSAHFVRANQSGPITLNSEEKDTSEGLYEECLTKSVLSLDYSTKGNSFPDFGATENKANLVRASQSGPIVSLSENKNRGEALKRECITKSILGLEDLQQHRGGRRDAAAKSFRYSLARKPFKECQKLLFRTPNSLARKSFKVLDVLPILEQSNSVRHLVPRRRLALKRWVRLKKSQDLPRTLQMNCSGGLTAQSASFLHWPIGLPDGGHIVSVSEKKIVTKTFKRKCRTMSVRFEDHNRHFSSRFKGAANSLGSKRMCKQHGINLVSTVKRIHRQLVIHRCPFRRGYSLGGERPAEVISLSTHVKLVLRLQLIYISWLGRFSPRPSALARGGEIGGLIALSLSESAATKNIAQRVGQDQSGSTASDNENERTREQEDLEEIYTSMTSDDLRRLYGRMNRNNAAASLGVGRPPDQHGEGSTSTARKMPSHNVLTGMEGEPVGQNQEANVFQRDFMGGPIAMNTESGLIMVSRPPDQHGERNTSTACETPSHNVETGMEVEPVAQNQEANVFRRDFMGGPIALNTDGLTFPKCFDAAAPSQPMATILHTIPHLTGVSSECEFQVKNPSTQFTAYPNPNGLVDPHPQIASTQMLSENLEIRSCSDLALSQPRPTIPHTTGCSEYWRNSLALLEEHLLEENEYGSINLTAPSCFDPGLSQPLHTIPHRMPTIPQMMHLLTERQDMRSVRLKATYGNTTIKFPLPSGFGELKEEVSKRLEFERGSFKLEYKDEEGDSVLIACDEDVRDYLRLLTSLGNQVVKLFVLDKVPITTNFCDNCRSLKC